MAGIFEEHERFSRHAVERRGLPPRADSKLTVELRVGCGGRQLADCDFDHDVGRRFW